MKRNPKVPQQFKLLNVEALTKNQGVALNSERNLVLNGSAGSGKTFLALYKGFKYMQAQLYSRVVIVRSIVETRKIGFLPGTEREKIEVYERPYMDISSELYGGDNTAYGTLKSKNKLHFMPTSFIRGTTLQDAVIIVDECQNMTYHELDSIITRVGPNSKIIFCGDYYQSDINDTGIKKFFQVLEAMKEDFDFVEFTTEDIVRSTFVKSYLTTKYEIHGKEKL